MLPVFLFVAVSTVAWLGRRLGGKICAWCQLYMALLLIYFETPSCAGFALAFLFPVSRFLKRVDLVIGRFRAKSVGVKKSTLRRSSQVGNTLRCPDLEKNNTFTRGKKEESVVHVCLAERPHCFLHPETLDIGHIWLLCVPCLWRDLLGQNGVLTGKSVV